MTRRQKLHALMFAGVMVMLLAGGWEIGNQISTAPVSALTTTLTGQTVIRTHTRVLTKKIRGRVVTLHSGQRVIRVPLVVIRNLRCHPNKHHHCVRRVVVPAHSIPLRAATAHQPVAVAAVMVPVTVYATVTSPPITVTLPMQTVTETQTDTTTETAPTVTVTVTVPPNPGAS